MDISVGRLLPLASVGEAGVQPGAGQSHAGVPFQSVLQDAMQNLREAQAQSAQDSYDLATGNAPDLHAIMINSAKETTAVETVVQLASRAVSAYKEIMQMQI